MKYKAHKLMINMENNPYELERYLNNLKGEVISIIPNVARTSLVQIFGGSRKIDFLLIIEKLK
jgi:hypothetical protein